ncbi:hypothetical protein T552_02827 [Pneumocystis carinii B80]|uniref:Uncharacterized protein n=1 Tax=Pneumocystis carinii (strain B80) TaxID=1408658 RepID=A0A0W4ZD62_PNEC8|nr:hypothetical protein T552_02827 [Pneumocystis carinii B80]KTW26342.1 hypothetical protein T552_02827 [Pneumocystis carinii B80]
MGPVLKTRLEKDNKRFNAYFKVRKKSKEQPADENVDGLLKNAVGGVVAKIISTVNWTYMSIFGKTGSEEWERDKEEFEGNESGDKRVTGEERMLCESRTPYLLGYTPHTVRVQHFREKEGQKGYKNEGYIEDIVLEGFINEPSVSNEFFVNRQGQFGSNNFGEDRREFEKTQSSGYVKKEGVLESYLGYGSEKNLSNVKNTKISPCHLYSETRNFKKQQKKNVLNNYLTFDCVQLPKNSSTGILTAWREICRQEILLKNNMTEQQLHKSKLMYMNQEMPVRNLNTNVQTRTFGTEFDNMAFNCIKKERKLIQIPERRKNHYNRFNNAKHNSVCSINNFKTNNIEDLRTSENIKQRKTSENCEIPSYSDIQKTEISHRRSKSYSLLLSNSKKNLLQKEKSDGQSVNVTAKHQKVQAIEDKSISYHNAQKNNDSENIKNKSNLESNKNPNLSLCESNSQNHSFFVNNQVKRKRPGYFSALEEDLEEMFGPYNDIDDTTILFKKRKNKDETNQVDYKESVCDSQKRNSDYQQPYFRPRVPLLKKHVSVDTTESQCSSIDDSEKSISSESSLKIKQTSSNKHNIGDSKLSSEQKNSNFVFPIEKNNDDESKIQRFNTNATCMTLKKDGLDQQKDSGSDNFTISKEQDPNTIKSQHSSDHTNNISFLSNIDKENHTVEKKIEKSIFNSNQQFSFDINVQKNHDSSNNEKAEIKTITPIQFSGVKEIDTKSQNTTFSGPELGGFTSNSNKATDVSKINNEKESACPEKSLPVFSVNMNEFQTSQDATKNRISAFKPADTIMEMDSSPEKKEVKFQSQTPTLNFAMPISDTKNIFKFQKNESNSSNQKDIPKVQEPLKLDDNRNTLKLDDNGNTLKHKEISGNFPILENTKTDTNSSQIPLVKPSISSPQNVEQKTLPQFHDNNTKVLLEPSFSISKPVEFSTSQNTNLFNSTENKPQTLAPFSFFGSLNSFSSQEKQTTQVNTTNEEQKNVPSNDKPEFNFTQLNQPKSTNSELNQTSTTSFSLEQNKQPALSTFSMAPTPVFSFGSLDQPKKEFSFDQSAPNTFFFQNTPNNSSVFQFKGDKDKTATHEFTFNLNNTSSSTSSTPSAPFIFGSSTTGSSNLQTVPSFNFGANNYTSGNFSQFQPGQQQTQTQTTNMNFSFNQFQNTMSQDSNATVSNPFVFTFGTPQSSVPGRKIAAPKSRLRRR